jgi:hypothetical protein
MTDVDKSLLHYGISNTSTGDEPHRKPTARQTTSSHSAMPNNNPANPCADGKVSHSAGWGDVFTAAKSINSELDQNAGYVQLSGVGAQGVRCDGRLP